MIKIDDTHIALAYAGVGNDGFLKIFEFDGAFDLTYTSGIEHDTTQGTFNSLRKLKDGYLVLAYSGASNYGYLKIFTYDEAYALTQIESHEIAASVCQSFSLIVLDDTHLIVCYRNSSGYGTAKTFEIDNTDNITELDSLTYNAVSTIWISAVQIDNNHFAICGSEGATTGKFRTFYFEGVSYIISGVVTLSGVPIEGAIVRCIRQSDNVALPDVLTNISGEYVISDLDIIEVYHLSVEYEDGDATKYNALSLWDIVPIEL